MTVRINHNSGDIVACGKPQKSVQDETTDLLAHLVIANVCGNVILQLRENRLEGICRLGRPPFMHPLALDHLLPNTQTGHVSGAFLYALVVPRGLFEGNRSAQSLRTKPKMES